MIVGVANDVRLRLGPRNVSSCNFDGPFPTGLKDMTSVHDLDLSYNKLNESLPRSVDLFPKSVKFMNLAYNNLVGYLPSYLTFLTGRE